MGGLRFGPPEPAFYIYVDKKNDWRWRIVAKNGREIGASSEGFDSKRNCLNNLKLLADALLDYHTNEKDKP
jgi:uncharacterized protein YegP (UPF0339 family)